MMTAIFSTLSVLSFFLAPITGDLADRVGPRYVVGAGALLMGIGLLLTARIYSFPLLFVTWGLCVGASVACVYIPAIAAVGEWFQARRDIALGIAISGIGCGTLIAAPLSARLTVLYGWRGAFEVFGWASMAMLLGCAALLSRPPILRAKDTANVMGMARTRTFILLYIALIFAGIAIYCSFVFLPAFAMDIGASHVAGATLIGYVGAASVVGRLRAERSSPVLWPAQHVQNELLDSAGQLRRMAHEPHLSGTICICANDGSGLWRDRSHDASGRSGSLRY